MICSFVLQQAIQDITRNRELVPEEVVALIFEKIDVNGEGENQLTYDNPHHYAFIYSTSLFI